MSNLNNTISQNFSSDSSIRKNRKIINQIKSAINLQHFENAKPSFYNNNKSPNNTSKKDYIRHQWSLKRDEIIVKELKIKKTDLINELKSATYERIVQIFETKRKNIKIINVIISLIDLITISLINVSHFMFLNKNFKLNKNINIIRLFCTFFSIINSILVVIRLFILKHIRLIKYVLNIRLTYPPRNINYLKAFLEILIHLLFPYPYFSYKVSNKEYFESYTTVYTSDMILLILSFIRIYTISRLFLLTLDFRSIRLWKLFNNKKILIFKYRCLIQSHPVLTNLSLMIIFLIITTYVFQILENIEEKDQKLNFYNSFWLLSQTIINCGFGEYEIKTTSTRILIALVILFGFHITISLILAILSTFEYQTENEIKAYQQIKLVYNKNQKNTSYSIYFEHYLKYKLIRIKDTLKSHKRLNNSSVLQKINISLALRLPFHHERDNMIFKILNMKNQLKIDKEKYFLNILGKLKFEPTFNDFFNFVKNKFDIRMKECIYRTDKNLDILISYHTFFCENIKEFYCNALDIYYQSNRITNLMLLIFWTGSRFNIKDFDNLIKYKVIGIKEFDLKYREFRLIYYSRIKKRKFLGKNNNDIKLSKLSKDSDSLNKFSDNIEFESDLYDSYDYEFYDDEEFENESSAVEKNSNSAEMSSFLIGNY